MNALTQAQPFSGTARTERYAKCIELSQKVRWDIETDVVRGRELDFTRTFLPEGLARIASLDFLDRHEQLLLSQIQGRTYANMFSLVERFICLNMLQVSQKYALEDPSALTGLVRLCDDELKHQRLFCRIEQMMADGMQPGYRFVADPDAVASAVLAKSTWAVLALILHIEVFVQSHYRESIDPHTDLCPLWKDVFLFHWREESQHVVMDELEWSREDEHLAGPERDQAVDDLISLFGAVDGIVQAQAAADAAYFCSGGGRAMDATQARKIQDRLVLAYRWQYIQSGIQNPRFLDVFHGLITPGQRARVDDALAAILL